MFWRIWPRCLSRSRYIARRRSTSCWRVISLVRIMLRCAATCATFIISNASAMIRATGVERKCLLARCNYYCHSIGVFIRARLQARAGYLEEVDAADIRFVACGVESVPGVQTEVMVIAIPGNEASLLVQINHQFQAKCLLVVGKALLQIADVEMHVAEDRPTGQAMEILSSGQQGLYVQAERVHGGAAVRRGPLLARPVSIDLDAVAFGIIQVKRLADQVVGSSVDAHSPFSQAGGEESALIGLAGQQERKVIQAGGVSGARAHVRCMTQREQFQLICTQANYALRSLVSYNRET